MAERVAIIGGSAEARDLARALGPHVVWVGLAEPERRPARWPVAPSALPDTATALADVLSRAAVEALIDASHPCDAATPAIAAGAARILDLPHARLSRPPWRPTRRDRWVQMRSPAGAARHLAPGTRLLVTLGLDALPALRALRQHVVILRQRQPRTLTFPLRIGGFSLETPPFSVADEVAILRRLRIDALMTCNAGGAGGWPKLAAARALGLPVLMVARPAPPAGPRVSTVDRALHWLKEA